MFKKVIIVITLLITLAVVSFHFIFVIPNKPNLITSSQGTSNDTYSCYQNSAPKAIDVSDGLTLRCGISTSKTEIIGRMS